MVEESGLELRVRTLEQEITRLRGGQALILDLELTAFSHVVRAHLDSMTRYIEDRFTTLGNQVNTFELKVADVTMRVEHLANIQEGIHENMRVMNAQVGMIDSRIDDISVTLARIEGLLINL